MATVTIPFKKGAAIDIICPLKKYIVREFSAGDASKYEKDLSELSTLRSQALSVTSATESGKIALEKYYSQIIRLAALFPISDQEINIAFTWNDAFISNKKRGLCSIEYDQACILYNMAVLESQMGNVADNSTEEGIKAAFKHFQQAAGMFVYLKEVLAPKLSGVLTPDLSPTGLALASTVMLAQAQGCFFNKALRDKKKSANIKPGLLAKIAMQAAEYFRAATELATSPDMAGNMETSFAGKLGFQRHAFTAQGQYWQALEDFAAAEEIGQGYGGVIARLQGVQLSVQEGEKLQKRYNLGPTLSQHLRDVSTSASAECAHLIKDNQTIYLESIPPTGSLPSVAKLVAAKPSDMPIFECPNPLFADMLPKEAMIVLDKYRRESAPLVSNVQSRAKTASLEAKNRLAEVGLPGSLEAQQSQGGISDAVWKKVVRTQEGAGGLAELREKIVELQSSAERASDILASIDKALVQEEARDESFKRRYVGSYESSSTATADLKRDVLHFRSLWKHAQSNDTTLMNHLDQPHIQKALEILCLSRDKIDEMLPSHADFQDEAPDTVTRALSGVLEKLAALLCEREAVCSRIAVLGKGDEEFISRLRSGGNYSEVTNDMNDRLQASITNFNQLIEDQEDIIKKALFLNEEFQVQKNKDFAAVAREQLMDQLNEGVNEFHAAHAQLSEGVVFYSDLLKQIIRLQQTAEDLVYTRGVQRREVELQNTYRRQVEEQQENDAKLAQELEEAGKSNAPTERQPSRNPFDTSSDTSTARAYPSPNLPPSSHIRPNAPPPVPPKPRVLEPRLAQLVDMGFHPDIAQRALQAANGNVDEALEKLLNGS